MIDALLYAVRDSIRAANIGYGVGECELSEDGKPPPRCGNFFVAVHGGTSRSERDNQLYEFYDFSVTLTMRMVAPLDRVADQQIARNVPLVPLGYRQGFNNKVEQLRNFLHMNWNIVVVQNQTPNSANDNLAAWCTGTVYGFVEPMRFRTREKPVLIGDEWFNTEPRADGGDPFTGIKSELQFRDAKRFQPQTAATGPFI